MSKLTAGARAKLKPNQFAGPGRSYPVEDKGHARAAIVDSSRAEKSGALTAAERARIVRKADAELRKGK
jgi:hypothetical protein